MLVFIFILPSFPGPHLACGSVNLSKCRPPDTIVDSRETRRQESRNQKNSSSLRTVASKAFLSGSRSERLSHKRNRNDEITSLYLLCAQQWVVRDLRHWEDHRHSPVWRNLSSSLESKPHMPERVRQYAVRCSVMWFRFTHNGTQEGKRFM